MKLYTEEQVRYCLSEYYDFTNKFIDYCLSKITPIELPSDEEIDEAFPYIPSNSKIDYLSYQKGFEEGVKWMKEQIVNQNK